jgi:hypothetical protein
MLFFITSNKKGKLMEILLMVDIKLFANIEFLWSMEIVN